MTIIAIDRYQAIINPLRKRITTSLPTVITILFIWIAAALFSIPNVVFNRVVEIVGHTNLHRCRAIYPKPEIMYRRYITLFTFLTQYAIPLSITTFAYIRISFYIWNELTLTKMKTNICDERICVNGNDGGGGASTTGAATAAATAAAVPVANDSATENSLPSLMAAPSHSNTSKNISFKSNCFQASMIELRERSRRKSIKMLALVVAVFSICWLPLNIFHLNSDFFSSNRISDPNIFFICHWFAMSSVCYNPFIYFWLNRHFRQEIKHLICCTNAVCWNHPNLAASPVMNMSDGHSMKNHAKTQSQQHQHHHHHFVQQQRYNQVICVK